MIKSKKAICAVIAAALAFAMLSGCGASVPITGAPVPSGANSTTVPAKDDREPGLYIDGKKQAIDTVVTLGEHQIGFDEFRYYFLNIQAQAAAAGETDDAKLRDATLSQLKNAYALIDNIKANSITLTDEEKAKVVADYEAQKAQFTSEADFNAALNSSFLTESLLKENIERQALSVKSVYELNRADIEKNVADNYVHVKHVLIQFPEEAPASSSSMPPKDHAAELAKAQEVLAKAKAGDDFDELMKTYNEDPGEPAEGYYFTTGKMVKEFEDAAFALKDGEVSEIVETDYGYHIIKRYEFEPEEMRRNAIMYMSDDAYAKLTADMSAKATAYEVKPCELFDKITVGSIA